MSQKLSELTLATDLEEGDLIYLVKNNGSFSSQSFDVSPFLTVVSDFSVTYLGTPSDEDVIGKHVATRTTNISSDFTGSQGSVGNNPTSTWLVSVLKNGNPSGFITVNTDGDFTFETEDNESLTLNPGDDLTFISDGTDAPTDISIRIFALGVFDE